MKPVPLMATTDEELKVSPIRAVFDSTIGHSSIPNQVSITTNTLFGNKSISEAGLSQNSIFKTITEVGSIEVSTVSIHVGEDSSPQISFGQISATQINRVQIGISDDSTSETSLFQNRSKQIASAQIGLSKISLIQTSSTQINFLQTQPPQVDFVPFDIKRGLDQLNSSKVTLPLEVATNQFFWSHLQDYHFTSNFLRFLHDNYMDRSYTEVVMALHDALARSNRWIDHTNEQYQGAYDLLISLVNKETITETEVESSIIQLENLGFDTLPFGVQIDNDSLENEER